MFVGYSVHHVHYAYGMLNIDTKSIIQERETILLNEAYQNWIEKKVLQKKGNYNNDDDDIANSKTQEVNDGQDKLRIECGIVKIQKQEENGKITLKRILVIWKSNKFGK
jgi:hypothetical protein